MTRRPKAEGRPALRCPCSLRPEQLRPLPLGRPPLGPPSGGMRVFGPRGFSSQEHKGSLQGRADLGAKPRARGQRCASCPASGSYDFGPLGNGSGVPVPELTYGSSEKFTEASL